MKQNILISILSLVGLSLASHQAQAEISVPKKISVLCDNEELYKQLVISSFHCYREVMNKSMEYRVLVPLVDEFGETIVSAATFKHVKSESYKIYYHYNILMKTINN